jgi:hypothetical protein
LTPNSGADGLIDSDHAKLSSDINRSLSVDHLMSNIPIEEAVDPKALKSWRKWRGSLMPRLINQTEDV